MQLIAVDWSGDLDRDGAGKIWSAIVSDDGPPGLVGGLGRHAVVEMLGQRASDDPALVVGIDCSFSLPAWFLRARGYESAAELWASAPVEEWLIRGAVPFWGRPGQRRPADGHEPYRETERQVRRAGAPAKSTFQIGGAGAVGTGSLRAWAHLARLRAAGFAIWPFDAPRFPMVVEVYPRLCTGPVVKTRVADRQSFLERTYPDLPPAVSATAAASEDAFDALVTVLVMQQHAAAFTQMTPPDHPDAALEGWVWMPGSAG